MRRVHFLLTALLATGAAAGTASGAQASSPAAHAAKAAKVQLRKTHLGKILVNSSGFTLYRFTKDPRNKNTCLTSTGGGGAYGSMTCNEVWPALTTSGKPVAGAGVKSSQLGTINIGGGRKQVTYGGHPLYLYSPSTEPGETSYVGINQFGGRWDAVNAAGGLVK
jgi:predicted lipoprotein with Yx(FWY)xxD motif